MTIVEFIRERVEVDMGCAVILAQTAPDPDEPEHILAQVILTESRAKLAILDILAPERHEGDGVELAANLVLRTLASVYQDHPDYDPEWSVNNTRVI